jgi:heme exporter protein CcmD
MSWNYVWSAYLVTMFAMGVEVVFLLKRRRALRNRSAEMGLGDRSPHARQVQE